MKLTRRAARHARRVSEACLDRLGAARRAVRRSVEQQMARRRLERAVRLEVLCFARWLGRSGRRLCEAAERLGLSVETVERWRNTWSDDRLRIKPRGRPLERAETAVRNMVLAVMGLCGPGVSVRALEDLFPRLARREIEHLLRRYRAVWRKKNRGLMLVLESDNGSHFTADEAPGVSASATSSASDAGSAAIARAMSSPPSRRPPSPPCHSAPS